MDANRQYYDHLKPTGQEYGDFDNWCKLAITRSNIAAPLVGLSTICFTFRLDSSVPFEIFEIAYKDQAMVWIFVSN